MPLHDFHVTPLLAASTAVYCGTNVRFLQTLSERCCYDVPDNKAGVFSHVRTCTLRPTYTHVRGLLNMITLKIGRERKKLCRKRR
jgi:hypothetical protein